jgi:tetratricopeptide (TPR) repeat protein
VAELDKYEYKLKLDQMKSLTAEGKYEEAAEIADTINWRKIKNINALVKVGEIYEKVGRYDESKDVLLTAYDKSPIGRMIIYRLAEVAVRTKSFDEAKEYYQEFVEIAPHDNLKYVLKYEISKAQGADIGTLIGILEELKEQEYSSEPAKFHIKMVTAPPLYGNALSQMTDANMFLHVSLPRKAYVFLLLNFPLEQPCGTVQYPHLMSAQTQPEIPSLWRRASSSMKHPVLL